MKKITVTVFTVLILTLTACGSASNRIDPSSALQNGGPPSELPTTTQLVVGTLKLDETENAVTAEQAVELLPLWQTLQVLDNSDTAAQQETDALIVQIQETMTAEQMQAITDMNLTRADVMSMMQEQGMVMGNGQASTSQNGNSSSNSGQGFGPGAGMPPPDERGFPGGGPGMGSGGQGQSLSAEQIATAQAARQAAGGNSVPPMLINVVIEYLQEKTGS